MTINACDTCDEDHSTEDCPVHHKGKGIELGPCRRCTIPMVSQKVDKVPVGRAKHMARRLCRTCYEWARSNGKLFDFPMVKRTTADTVEEHDFLSSQGLSRDQIAARLGMKWPAIERAVYRHRARQRAA